MRRAKHVTSGDWRTLETFINAAGTAFFEIPVGAEIKVRYGVGFFGKDRQKQRLDGKTRKLQVGGAFTLARARFQIKVQHTTDVTYDVYPGNGTINVPLPDF